MRKKTNDILYSHIPASWYGDLWKDAFPSGNGKTGISVYGAIKKETILVNHCNLWHWGKRSEVPDVSAAFRDTKKLLKEGQYQKANPLTAKALRDAGYEAELYKPCPVGDIRIDMEGEDTFSGYERSLNMSTGEVTVAWKSGKVSYIRNIFVSRKMDIIVLGLHASEQKAGLTVRMQLHETFGEDTMKMRCDTKVSCYQKEDAVVYKAENTENGCFGIACIVLKCNGAVDYDKDKIVISHTSDLTLIFKVFGDMDEVKTDQDAIQYLCGISGTYEQLRDEHVKEHSELYHSADFELEKTDNNPKSNEEMLYIAYKEGISNNLCEKLWKYGRYLFISGTRPDMLPFPMYGLWGGRYDLLWSHNMANINIQMIYWHCITGGYADYIKAFINYYCDMMPDFRENARKIFGLDGILLPAGTTPGYGVMNQLVPVIVNWIGGAGWIAQHMYDYYLATGDELTLRAKILPFMEEAALFYEQFLTWDGANCQIIPSVSPENTPGNLQDPHLLHMAHANPTAKNATMDVAILKELFRNLIDVSQKFGCNNDKIPLWNDIIKGLPAYQINADGAVKEWLADDLTDFYYHRHFSHLYPVFPGREMMLIENTELQEAFQKAVKLRVQGGQSGWSLIFRACLFARLKDGNEALDSLETLTKSCLTNSFLSLHNDWRNMGLTLDLDEFEEGKDKAPVQLDASIGTVNAIQEMILQYAPGVLWLLPALPDKWNRGRITRFAFMGGDLDMEWDMKNTAVSCCIRCNKKQHLKIRLPQSFLKEQIEITLEKKCFKGKCRELIELDIEKNDMVGIQIGKQEFSLQI